MDVNDYLIDISELNWDNLLSEWTWLLDDDVEFQPWMMNRFGDLFWVDGEGVVNLLNVTDGTIEAVSETEAAFLDLLEDEDTAFEWFMVDLVDELLEQEMQLRDGECYGFKVLPVLGGEFEPGNVYVSGLEKYWSFCGDVHRQINDLPDGAEIKIDIPNR